MLKLTPDQLRPSGEDAYDLDQVYEWAAGEPDPVHVSALGNVVDMVAKIADCCDDGALRRLVEGTPEYAELVDDEISYQGKDGAQTRGTSSATRSPTRGSARSTESIRWLSWQGDFSDTDLEAETAWDRVGAEPIEIVLPKVTLPHRARRRPDDPLRDEYETAFIGGEDTVAVFTDVADLAHYCRTAEDHALQKLEWWSELAEIEDDDAFAPAPEASYDLRKPSTRGAQLLRELATFCNLELDADVLDADPVNRDDWRELLAEVQSCFEPQD